MRAVAFPAYDTGFEPPHPAAMPVAMVINFAGVARVDAPAQNCLLVRDRALPLQFENIEALARKIHDLRDGGGLRLEDCQVEWPGFLTFDAVNVYRIDAFGTETWIACAALQGRGRRALEAAIRWAEPSAPQADDVRTDA